MQKAQRKKARRIGFTALCLLAGSVGSTILFLRFAEPSRPAEGAYTAVSQNGEDWYFRASQDAPPARLPLTADSLVRSAADGTALAFTALSTDASGKYDLYFCAAGNKKAPVLLAHGVENQLEMTADAALLYYAKQNEKTRATEHWALTRKTGKSKVFAAAVTALYVPNQGESVYYTKSENRQNALWVYADEKNRRLVPSAENVQFFRGASNSELFYESGKALYRVDEAHTPRLLGESIAWIIYAHYRAGGNLYFFSESAEKPPHWREVIPDRNALTDSGMTQPKKADYVSIFGYARDYELALERYESKLRRDEIRAALDAEIAESYAPKTAYALHVYSAGETRLLCEQVSPDTVSDYRESGTPAAIRQRLTLQKQEKDLEALTQQEAIASLRESMFFTAQTVP